MAIDWVFFLGVHTTVTPMVLSTCERERDLIKEFGTWAVLPKEIRKYLAEAKKEQLLDGGPLAEGRQLSKFILRKNAELSENEAMEKVLLVEEAILGSCRINVMTGLLYPNLDKKIRGIPSNFDNPWHTICFCIKPYHEFFEDCYYSSPLAAQKIDLAEFKAQVLEFSRTWIDVIEDISGRLPNIGMQIWRADEARKLREPIERVLFGAASGIFFSEAAEHSTFSTKPKQGKLTIWTEDEVRICEAQFESDWHHITSGWPDFLLN
jgi:hypothetical protein